MQMTSPEEVLELVSLCRVKSLGYYGHLCFVSVCLDTTSQHTFPSTEMSVGTYLFCDFLL